MKPWLLEINVGPSMDSYNCKNQMACTHKDCSISPVDSYVKKQVMFDAITLMLHARELGGVHLMDNQFRSLSRLYPSADPADMEVYDRLRDIRYLFLAITKGKQEMTSNEFV